MYAALVTHEGIKLGLQHFEPFVMCRGERRNFNTLIGHNIRYTFLQPELYPKPKHSFRDISIIAVVVGRGIKLLLHSRK